MCCDFVAFGTQAAIGKAVEVQPVDAASRLAVTSRHRFMNKIPAKGAGAKRSGRTRMFRKLTLAAVRGLFDARTCGEPRMGFRADIMQLAENKPRHRLTHFAQ